VRRLEQRHPDPIVDLTVEHGSHNYTGIEPFASANPRAKVS
jgi:hypothetical protein